MKDDYNMRAEFLYDAAISILKELQTDHQTSSRAGKSSPKSTGPHSLLWGQSTVVY